ncbi:MAG: glycine zipper 2TM domain-containing protein [Sphingomonas sp.]|nr:glycine zipper 2TM domain-containing protein [Sphingomonas sp.]
MPTLSLRNTALIALAAATALPLAACSDGYGNDRPGYGYRDTGYGDGYVLGRDDPIYRDRDGSYYCRKPDGTRGAIIGGLAGGVLGNIIAPDGSKTLGTIIGAAGGAVLGSQIDKGKVRCR